MSVWQLAASIPWAMEREWLEVVLQVAARQPLDPETVARLEGQPLRSARRAQVRDGVAVIPVHRPIFRRANLFTDLSGATSIELLARDLNLAVQDAGVKAVLLDFDTPGGEANGVGELARMIAELKTRKPIHGYVGGQACSGGYWLAAACDSVTVDPTAILGSIGVVAVYRRGAGKDQVEILSDQSPNKRPDPETDQGRLQIVETLNAIAAVFIGDVARYRGLDPQEVVERFGAGGVRVGQAAVDCGMADRLGSFEGLLAQLAGDCKLSIAHCKLQIAAEAGEVVMAAGSGVETLVLEEDELDGGHSAPDAAAGLADAPGAEVQRLRALLEQEREARVSAETERELLRVEALRRELADELAKVRLCEGRLELAPATRRALVEGLRALGATERAPILTALRDLQVVQLGEAGFPAVEAKPTRAPDPERVKELAGMTPLGA